MADGTSGSTINFGAGYTVTDATGTSIFFSGNSTPEKF